MGSGYPALVQRTPQMVRAIAEPGVHMETSGVDPNDESYNSNSSDHEDSDLDSWVYQAEQSKQESRTKSVVHVSWDDSPDCQTPALKPSSDFCVVDLSLRVQPRWLLRLRVSIMGRSLLSLQMVLRNQRPVLTSWNQLLLLLPFLGKWF